MEIYFLIGKYINKRFSVSGLRGRMERQGGQQGDPEGLGITEPSDIKVRGGGQKKQTFGQGKNIIGEQLLRVHCVFRMF